MADDRDAILARRRRLIALALAGGAVATTASCSACLTLIDVPQGDAPADARDAPRDALDASAMPCLSPPLDAPDAPPDDAPLDAPPGDTPEDDAGDGDGG